MNKEEFLKKIGDIEIIYSLPIFVKNYTKEHHALVQYKMLAFDLEHEIERLNNIINKYEEKTQMLDSVCSSLEFSAPENDYIFKGRLREIIDKLNELKENK